MDSFGNRLRQLRKSVPLNQKQLATELGVASSLISAYETGERLPSYETLIQLSVHFHVSIDYLLGQEKYPSILVDGLDEKDFLLVYQMVERLRQQKK